jgi:hypothetical protein
MLGLLIHFDAPRGDTKKSKQKTPVAYSWFIRPNEATKKATKKAT